MRQIKYIILHCTAGPQSQTIPTIRAWWRKQGWTVDGYHYIITPEGEVVNLVPIERVSNGVKGYNAKAINICYIGGVETDEKKPEMAKGRPVDNRTSAQRIEMEKLVRHFHNLFPGAMILGHRDLSPDKNRNGIVEESEWVKSCPSFSVAKWLEEINFKSRMPKTLFTTTGVNIRTGPGIEFPLAAPRLERDTVVRFLGVDGEWSMVYVEGDNIKGFVNNRYLRA